MWLLRVGLVVAALGCASLTAADPFEFKDGDRVVLLGSTLIEREQKYGYWELALTELNAGRNLTFRNLGWSGDTVFGDARNGFDESPKGFERLVSLTRELKPTVVVVCYGHNESFEGEAGVAKFTAGLEKLLDALAPTKARVVLMSPTPFENTGPMKDAAVRNKNLALYRDAIKSVVEKRKVQFVDLLRLVEIHRDALGNLTDNGMHLGGDGYLKSSYLFHLGLHGQNKIGDQALPIFRATIQEGSLQKALRTKIVEKNQLFFHRWRPQNETYLFGFRKHEQGKNAVEVAAFDPLVAKAEKEIAEVKKLMLAEPK